MIGRLPALVTAAIAVARSFAAASPDLAFTVPGVALHGRVVDEWGKPIAGAEVLLCDDNGPCRFAMFRGVTWRGTLAGLVASLPLVNRNPDHYTLTTTRADGSWRARLIVDPQNASDTTRAVVTAPHREIVERTALRGPLDADIALRPASTLHVEPQCGGTRCAGTIEISLAPYTQVPDSHIERLAPATYSVVVYANRNEPGEHRGTAVVEATFTPRALQITVALQPFGSGLSIRGTGGFGNNSVSSTCWGGGVEIHRSASTDASGGFELRDVGAPPCVVDSYTLHSHVRAKVDTLPATGVVLR
jgi:hypothetical protein